MYEMKLSCAMGTLQVWRKLCVARTKRLIYSIVSSVVMVYSSNFVTQITK